MNTPAPPRLHTVSPRPGRPPHATEPSIDGWVAFDGSGIVLTVAFNGKIAQPPLLFNRRTLAFSGRQAVDYTLGFRDAGLARGWVCCRITATDDRGGSTETSFDFEFMPLSNSRRRHARTPWLPAPVSDGYFHDLLLSARDLKAVLLTRPSLPFGTLNRWFLRSSHAIQLAREGYEAGVLARGALRVLTFLWGTSPRTRPPHRPALHRANPPPVPEIQILPMTGPLPSPERTAQGPSHFTVLVPPGAILNPEAASALAEQLVHDAGARLFFADHDCAASGGTPVRPFLKPAWSREFYQAHPDLPFPLFVRTDFLRDSLASQKPSGWEGLIGFLTAPGNEIIHIPRILCHHPHTAPADQTAVPPPVFTAPHSFPTPEVCIIIPTRDKIDLLRRCVTSLLKITHYPRLTLLIVDNGSRDPATLRQFREWKTHEKIRILPLPGPFNFSRLNNAAAQVSTAPLLLLLNNDTEIIHPDWLLNLVCCLQDPEVAAVGPRLLFADGTLQHAGIVLGMSALANHPYKGFPADVLDPTRMIHTLRPCSALTAACLLVRRSVYQEVDGFDESLPTSYNDVDFCLKLVSRGYRILYNPHSTLIHEESKSRGISECRLPPFRAALNHMRNRWHWRLRYDPYYHPSRTLDRIDCRLRTF
ncbi:MAG: glycosyltransferase family 2 protein [Verrucomicrobiae bacterium]|nr:glycosyltransferase family 2 protein [Verrucomicrobiae bacterium]